MKWGEGWRGARKKSSDLILGIFVSCGVLLCVVCDSLCVVCFCVCCGLLCVVCASVCGVFWCVRCFCMWCISVCVACIKGGVLGGMLFLL